MKLPPFRDQAILDSIRKCPSCGTIDGNVVESYLSDMLWPRANEDFLIRCEIIDSFTAMTCPDCGHIWPMRLFKDDDEHLNLDLREK